MLDFYLLEKCAEHFEKLAKANRILLYHGTSKENLNSILSQGLIPNPKERAWAEDPDANWYRQSRESLPGVYLTSNLTTATGAASHGKYRKKKAQPVLIIVSVQPQTLVMDEDNISSYINEIVYPKSIVNEWLASNMYFDWQQPTTGRGDSEFLSTAETEYINRGISSLEHMMNGTLHESLKERLFELLRAGFYVALTRKVAHINPEEYDRLWKRYGVQDSVAPIQPSIGQAEQSFKQYENKLTHTLKALARPENLSDVWRFTARTTTPIGYSKANRIVAIFELIDSKEDEYRTELIQIYPQGELPEDVRTKLTNDWHQSKGPELIIHQS